MYSELFNGPETVCASRWPLIITNQYYLRGFSGINSRTTFVQPLCGWPIFCSSIWSCMSSVRGRHDDVHSFQAIWSWSRPVGDSRRAKQAARLVLRMQPSCESKETKENKGDGAVISSDVQGHGLETCSLNLTVNEKRLKRVSNFRLLGTQANQHLNWKEEINSKISSCYASLAVIRKLKHLTPFYVRK